MSIQNELDQIKNAVYGREVRGAIHDAVLATNKVSDSANRMAEEANQNTDSVQKQLNQIVADGDSSVEAAQARVDATGYIFPTLKDRNDGDQLNIKVEMRGLSSTNTPEENTNILQRAIIDAESINGNVILPEVSTGEWIEINKPITIESGNIKILGSKENSRIKQTVYPNAIFDVIAPNVIIDGLSASGEDFTAHNTGTFRGHMEKSFYTAVAVYADNVTVRNVKADNLINGALFYGYDIVADEKRNIKNCRLERLEVSNVDFGFSASLVTDFSFHDIRGSHRQMPGSATPPHLVYIVGTTPGTNKEIKGSNVSSTGGKDGHAIKLSGIKGGTFDYLYGDKTNGLLWFQDSEDIVVNNINDTNDVLGSTSQGAIEFWGHNKNIEVNNLDVNMEANSKALRSSADTDSLLINNLNVSTNYTEKHTGANLTAPVDIHGKNHVINNPKVISEGVPWLAGVIVYASNNIKIINPETIGNDFGIAYRDGDGLEVLDHQNLLGEIGKFTIEKTGLNFNSEIRKNKNVLAYDNGDVQTRLNRTTRTSSGHEWQETVAGWRVRNGGIRSEVSGESLIYIDTKLADIRLTADVQQRNSTGQSIVLRVIDEGNYLLVRLNTNRGNAEIYKWSDGEATLLSEAPLKVQDNRVYKWDVEVFDDVIDFYVNKRHLISYQLSIEEMNKYGTSTNHGFKGSTNPSGVFYNIVWSSLRDES